MTKPRLVKVRALLYVLQHITKRGRAYFDTASCCYQFKLTLFLPLWKFIVNFAETLLFRKNIDSNCYYPLAVYCKPLG